MRALMRWEPSHPCRHGHRRLNPWVLLTVRTACMGRYAILFLPIFLNKMQHSANKLDICIWICSWFIRGSKTAPLRNPTVCCTWIFALIKHTLSSVLINSFYIGHFVNCSYFVFFLSWMLNSQRTSLKWKLKSSWWLLRPSSNSYTAQEESWRQDQRTAF